MTQTLTHGLIALVALSLLAGCGNKSGDNLHGNSTRQADVKQGKTHQQTHQPQHVAQHQSFGEPMRLSDADAVPVAQVLANPAKYEGQYVRIVGDVNKVCTSKGCWLEMADAQNHKPLFVKFTCPVEGRLIPMAAVGKPVVVEGIVKVKEISENEARHLKEESGATAEEVAQIKGPQKQITLESPAARVAGL